MPEGQTEGACGWSGCVYQHRLHLCQQDFPVSPSPLTSKSHSRIIKTNLHFCFYAL